MGARVLNNLKTKPSLLDALRAAAQEKIPADELRKQRVSFIMGSLNDASMVTRAKITEVLAKQEGKDISN